MEAVNEEKKEMTPVEEGKGKGKRSFWQLFYNFLVCGGIIVVLVVGVLIAVVISILFK